MTAIKRRMDKVRPSSRKTETKKHSQILLFKKKKKRLGYILPPSDRFLGFSEEVREFLEERDYSE
jgi:hypothetical protein